MSEEILWNRPNDPKGRVDDCSTCAGCGSTCLAPMTSHSAVTSRNSDHADRLPARYYALFLLVWLSLLVGSTFYAPNLDQIPFVALSASLFGIVPLAFPKARLYTRQPTCPLNWAIALFGLQLVIAPTLMVDFGVVRETLPLLPSSGYIDLAMSLQCLAYLAFVGGLHLSRRPTVQASGPEPVTSRTAPKARSEQVTIALSFLGLGIIGLGIRFPSFSDLLAYFSGHAPLPAFFTDTTTSSVSTAISTYLLPCLGLGVVLIWCRLARVVSRRNMWWLVPLIVGSGLVSIGAYSLFTYNRALGFYPLFALIAAFSLRVRRIGFGLLLVVGSAALVLLLAFGALRDAYYRTNGNELALSSVGPASVNNSDPNTFIQTYANGPQFLAFVLANPPNGGRLFFGSTIASSVLQPLPRIGHLVTPGSGGTIYNALIYGRNGVHDQLLPVVGELLWNFSVPGVLVGFTLLGYGIARIQQRFLASKFLSSAFGWQYVGMWIAFLIVGSVEPVAQTVVDFLPPIILVLMINKTATRSHTRGGATLRGAHRPGSEASPARVAEPTPSRVALGDR